MTAAPRAQGSTAALRVAVLEDDDLLRESKRLVPGDPQRRAAPAHRFERCVLQLLFARTQESCSPSSPATTGTSTRVALMRWCIHQRRRAEAAAEMPLPLMATRGVGVLFAG